MPVGFTGTMATTPGGGTAATGAAAAAAGCTGRDTASAGDSLIPGGGGNRCDSTLPCGTAATARRSSSEVLACGTTGPPSWASWVSGATRRPSVTTCTLTLAVPWP